jgi:hypothetical protein
MERVGRYKIKRKAEKVHVPLDLAVRLVHVEVGQDVLGEGRGRRVGDEAVDAVGEETVGALERVG